MQTTEITILEEIELNNPIFIEAFWSWSCG